jgi:hypothetical protein
MAHPWIAVANAGFYRDMHKIGFRTFGNIIDESFDSIENDLDRIERIAEVVEDLCQGDLVDFLAASQDICKYNQQRLAEYRKDLIDNFPNQFLNFIRENTQ